MSVEDMNRGYSKGSSEEEMNKEYITEPNKDEIEDQESGSKGMEENDEENNSDKEENDEESDVDSDKEDKDEIKKQIAEGKKELALRHEFSEEGFVYLLELLKPNSETTITSLDVGGKDHECYNVYILNTYHRVQSWRRKNQTYFRGTEDKHITH